MILPILLAFVTGVLVKLVDLIEDDDLKAPMFTSNILGILYGVLIAGMIKFFPQIAPVWIAAVIGVVLAGTIDAPGHYFGVATTIFLLAILGLEKMSWILLLIFIIAGFIEEFVNTQLLDKNKIKNKILKNILEFRPILEITVFISSLITGIWIMWFALLLFDIGYNGIRIVFRLIE